MALKTYTVTVASGSLYGGGTGNVFYLDGARNTTGPGTIEWVQGATLRFEQSDNSNDNHPLIFSTNTNTSGIISSGVTYYLDGVSNQTDYTNTTTFNAATQRYVEVTPSSDTDFYYLCYVHGIGMGGIFDITQNTWGSATWGANAWQSLVSLIDVTGQQVNSTIADVISTPSTGFGAGPYGFNEWNELQDSSPTATGISINTTVASVSILNEINAGYGANTWGFTTWGAIGDAVITGIELQSTLASVTITTSVTQGWSRGAWNEQVWGDSDEAAAPTGQQLDSTLASVTIDAEVNEGWSRLTWGSDAWGIAGDALATGQQINSTVATVTIDSEINLGWGRLTWGERDWGTNTLSASVDLTGQSLSISQGDEVASIDIDVELSTISNPGYGILGWGQQEWGTAAVNMFMTTAEGTVDPEPDAEVTGQVLASSIGTVTITGTATLELTGQILDISDGTAALDALTPVDVTGVLAGTVEINSAVAGASAEAELTGLTLTPTIGTESVNVWNEIDPNNSAVWTEIAA